MHTEVPWAPKLSPGDAVAVVSPSAGLPALFPAPFELGLRRLRDEFGLVPVCYPATRRLGATPQERAADLHAAFADPRIKAVVSSIGGDDQIRVLPHLDRELLRANPKPFFGYSDNTNLLVLLWNLGVPAYHGGSVMTQYGRPVTMHPATVDTLRAALFEAGPRVLREPERVDSVVGNWADAGTFTREPESEPAEPWRWHRADRRVEGRSWGGNLEILSWLMMADREILPPDAYEGCVLLLETSEEMPSAPDVYRILRNMGERGLLRRFPALLMARAKAWNFDRPLGPAERSAYRKDQREAVLRALAEYAPETMAVLDVDFGHTDPQLVLPYGGLLTVDGPARRITARY
ncbi:S66 family peptidase [Streptacidiphilus jiangxiensis]|uniref:Muramoyltetrapeptide carboxypeptidase LdcA (Peptidoglycan recycling) n=1 Tax=Streptacidiphilus jiangxiensis TaxID=235985 RepID=A0A1H7V7S0_STRJI|nr:S66 peptidase family protein [Streptacidiphilus jiangxiensis]SEM05054.1 Muramoyltetrapeptide carboxypeptidase LdcA (peptidoglycan recycling) [Streptacidiphilus jiangxiensis]